MIVISCIFLSLLSICRALPQARSTPSSLNYLSEPNENVINIPNPQAVEIVDETNLIANQPNNPGLQPIQLTIEDSPFSDNNNFDELWNFLENTELDSNGLELEPEHMETASQLQTTSPYNPTWQALLAQMSAQDLENQLLENLGLTGNIGNNNPPVVSQVIDGQVYNPIIVTDEVLSSGLGYVDQPLDNDDSSQASPTWGPHNRRLIKRDVDTSSPRIVKRSLVKRAETMVPLAIWQNWVQMNNPDLRYLNENINFLLNEGRILIRDGLGSQTQIAPPNDPVTTTTTVEATPVADPNVFLEETLEPIYDALIGYGGLTEAELAERLFNFNELVTRMVRVDDSFVSRFDSMFGEDALAFSLVAQSLSPNVHRKLFTNTLASTDFLQWARSPSPMGVNRAQLIIELSVAIDRILASFVDLAEDFKWIEVDFEDVTFDNLPDFSDDLVIENEPEQQPVTIQQPALNTVPVQQTTMQAAEEEDARDLLFDSLSDDRGPSFWSNSQDDDAILRAWLLSQDT
ncbi:hypothetical protein ABW21_db0204720 [Orbilia brochopaga]|nr:hypothetical protein ABW21_db0204720 [Drechslerella brochopaga]